MMDGLRSMVGIGFSLVALGNFTSQSWQLLKGIVKFLANTSKKLASKIAGLSALGSKAAEVLEKVLLISPKS